MKTGAGILFFRKNLMRWHMHENDRQLAWKEEKDPYKIWLAEILLQQTRAEQALPYYHRFIAAFPHIRVLAEAKEETVFRLWQGLGYYNRCKNMIETARTIFRERDSKFPTSYEELLQLKGVGSYTAAAIASFAFGLPCAVLDGNVYRVLSRFFGIETPVDSAAGKKEFEMLAARALETTQSAAYNQAIMDFGATICRPVNPGCEECPLRKGCVAYNQHLTTLLPVKSKRVKVKKRYFHYILLEKPEGSFWISKRVGKDVWQNLFEPFLVEKTTIVTATQLRRSLPPGWGNDVPIPVYVGKEVQRLTHQLIESHFFRSSVPSGFNVTEEGQWVQKTELAKFPFPKTVLSFFRKNFYF